MRVAVEQRFLDWRKNFAAGDFQKATAAYLDLLSLNTDTTNNQSLLEVQSEYRQALLSLVESWTRACTAGVKTEMDRIHQQAIDMLPDKVFGQDLLVKMSSCASYRER
jgi:hypothetical protein